MASDMEKGVEKSALTPSATNTSEHAGSTRPIVPETVRGLSPRHVQLMAIAGSIGTGLWAGVGSVLVKSGPLSLILGYLFWGLFFICPVNLCVGEMLAYLPLKGSIFELAARYADPALGFAIGWTFFFASVMLVCVEYSAVAVIISYWDATTNPAVYVAVAMVVCILLNIVAVKYYGESEFCMSITKVIMLFGLILITLITMAGGNPKGDAYGFRNWGSDPSSYMREYYTTGSTGRFLGWWEVVLYAGFTIGGPEMIALSAGEIQNPRRTIPRVAKMIFARIVTFYVIGVLCVGIICSANDKGLIKAISEGAAGAAASPWVVGIQNVGITGLPHLINALIMLSGLSCGNAMVYGSSRTLYGLARDGKAPKFLTKCTQQGVPILAIATVSVITCITFLVASNEAIDVFWWFIDLTTTGLIATYTMFALTYIFWYRARTTQNLDESTLPYRVPGGWYPAFSAVFCGGLALTFVGYDCFVPFSTRGFVTSYFGLAFAVVMFAGWKIWHKTKFVDPAEADLISGKKEVDEDCRRWEEGGIEENYRAYLATLPFWRRCWEKLW
ncbi:amino acid permease [Naviculisporaceae sp. PSN 640]